MRHGEEEKEEEEQIPKKTMEGGRRALLRSVVLSGFKQCLGEHERFANDLVLFSVCRVVVSYGLYYVEVILW